MMIWNDGDTDRISYYWTPIPQTDAEVQRKLLREYGQKFAELLEQQNLTILCFNAGFSKNIGKGDNWSCIARQCAVSGWLRRVHLPHRERSRHALHHPGRIESWRKKSQEGQAVSVFQSREPDVSPIKIQKEFNTIWTKPDLRCTKYLESPPKYSILGAIWSSLKEKDCSSIKTRSHAIAFFKTLLANCIEKVVCMRTEEDLYCKVYPILQVSARRTRAEFATWDVRIHPIPKREIRRPSKRTKREVRETCRLLLEDPTSQASRRSQRGKYRKTCHGKRWFTEFQVYFTQPSRKKTRIARNRQKTDSTIRESPEQETR